MNAIAINGIMMSQTIFRFKQWWANLLASTTDVRDRTEEGRKPAERAG
jgi:hypothetical protein